MIERTPIDQSTFYGSNDTMIRRSYAYVWLFSSKEHWCYQCSANGEPISKPLRSVPHLQFVRILCRFLETIPRSSTWCSYIHAKESYLAPKSPHVALFCRLDLALIVRSQRTDNEKRLCSLENADYWSSCLMTLWSGNVRTAPTIPNHEVEFFGGILGRGCLLLQCCCCKC